MYGFNYADRYLLYDGEFFLGKMHGRVKEFNKQGELVTEGTYLFG